MLCCLLLLLCACITPQAFDAVAATDNSSRTSRDSFCDSYERCFRVCVSCGRAILNTCPRETTDSIQPTLPLIFKSIRAAHQWHNSNSSGTTQVNQRTAHIHKSRNACVPPFQRTPRDFKSSTSRRGTLYIHQVHVFFSVCTDPGKRKGEKHGRNIVHQRENI